MTAYVRQLSGLVLCASLVACTESRTPPPRSAPGEPTATSSSAPLTPSTSAPATLTPTTPVPTTPAVEPLTAASLRSATLPLDPCGKAFGWRPRSLVMVAGKVPGEGPQNQTITVRSVAVGDLDGDRVDDGAVVLDCYPGGNGYWFAVVGYTAARGFAGQPRYQDVVKSSYEPVVTAARIARGRLRLTWMAYASEDPHCCPSRDVTGEFSLGKSGFKAVSHTVLDAESTMARLAAAVNRGDRAAAGTVATGTVVRDLFQRRAEGGGLDWSDGNNCTPDSGGTEYECHVALRSGWIVVVTVKRLRAGVWRAVAMRDFGGSA